MDPAEILKRLRAAIVSQDATSTKASGDARSMGETLTKRQGMRDEVRSVYSEIMDSLKAGKTKSLIGSQGFYNKWYGRTPKGNVSEPDSVQFDSSPESNREKFLTLGSYNR